jgi:hypothetical protein
VHEQAYACLEPEVKAIEWSTPHRGTAPARYIGIHKAGYRKLHCGAADCSQCLSTLSGRGEANSHLGAHAAAQCDLVSPPPATGSSGRGLAGYLALAGRFKPVGRPGRQIRRVVNAER